MSQWDVKALSVLSNLAGYRTDSQHSPAGRQEGLRSAAGARTVGGWQQQLHQATHNSLRMREVSTAQSPA